MFSVEHSLCPLKANLIFGNNLKLFDSKEINKVDDQTRQCWLSFFFLTKNQTLNLLALYKMLRYGEK